MAVINKSVTTSVTFSQPGSENTSYRRGVLSAATFTQLAAKAIGPQISKSTTSSITFTQIALKGHGYNKSASTNIVFTPTQTNGKLHSVSAQTIITFSLTVVKSRAYNVDASTTFVFANTGSKNGSVFVRSLVDSLRFSNGAFESDTQGKVYFMSLDRLSSIALKKPLFGNGQQLMSQIDIKHSRSGDVFSYKRVPSYETLVMQFDDINETLFGQIIVFLKAYAGQQIYFIDHKVATWKGFITTDPTDLKQFARNSCGDLYTFDVNFEGVKQ